MIEHPRTIAVLDDEPGMRLALRRLLRTHGYAVSLLKMGKPFYMLRR